MQCCYLKLKCDTIQLNKTLYFSPIDAYGFVREDDFDYKSHEEFESEYLVVLSRRSMRWDKEMKKDKYQHDRKSTASFIACLN